LCSPWEQASAGGADGFHLHPRRSIVRLAQQISGLTQIEPGDEAGIIRAVLQLRVGDETYALCAVIEISPPPLLILHSFPVMSR
jgi:hypothetical protein